MAKVLSVARLTRSPATVPPNPGHLCAAGAPLERAAASREAGATVAPHAPLRELNVAVATLDERRIEVISNGLPLWGRARFAVDTTIVSAPPLGTPACKEQKQTAHRKANGDCFFALDLRGLSCHCGRPMSSKCLPISGPKIALIASAVGVRPA